MELEKAKEVCPTTTQALVKQGALLVDVREWNEINETAFDVPEILVIPLSELESIAKQAVEQMAIQAEIIKITDYNEMMAYDILATPGLVINDKLVSYGRIPALTEVAEWLAKANESTQFL